MNAPGHESNDLLCKGPDIKHGDLISTCSRSEATNR